MYICLFNTIYFVCIMLYIIYCILYRHATKHIRNPDEHNMKCKHFYIVSSVRSEENRNAKFIVRIFVNKQNLTNKA